MQGHEGFAGLLMEGLKDLCFQCDSSLSSVR